MRLKLDTGEEIVISEFFISIGIRDAVLKGSCDVICKRCGLIFNSVARRKDRCKRCKKEVTIFHPLYEED